MAQSRYYRFAGDPQYYAAEYNGMGRPSVRAGESRGLGAGWDESGGGLPWPALSDDVPRGPLYFLPGTGPEALDPGALTKWQSVGLLPNLSDNEKRLVMIGVIGIVGYFFFGDKIKKAMKK